MTRKREHEAMFVITKKNRWVLTATFRHGEEGSPVAAKDGIVDKEAPFKYRLATLKCKRPCVLFSTPPICVLNTPEECWALAQWMIAASMAMQSAIDRRKQKRGDE
jgi:hypothetical protein